MLSVTFYHYLKTKIYTVLSPAGKKRSLHGPRSHVACDVWEVSCERSQIAEWFLLIVLIWRAWSFLDFVDFETTLINMPNRCVVAGCDKIPKDGVSLHSSQKMKHCWKYWRQRWGLREQSGKGQLGTAQYVATISQTMILRILLRFRD